MKIRHLPEEKRFVAENGERLGVLDYEERRDGTLDFRHTFVPQEHRGGGIASRLVRHALEHARDRGRKVIPSCPFVASFIDQHPEYEELKAEAG